MVVYERFGGSFCLHLHGEVTDDVEKRSVYDSVLDVHPSSLNALFYRF